MAQQVKSAAIWLLLLLQSSAIVLSERTRDKIYQPIIGASCFRRLNGTHQTGCSSTYSGSVGVLHLINVAADLEFLLSSPPSPPYAPLIPPHLFTRTNLLRLKEAGPRIISVVLLINRPKKMSQFSHELKCPNQYSGLKLDNRTETVTCDVSNVGNTWNPWGTGLLHEDFPFPIYYIADAEEIDKLENCFEKFNNFDYASHALRSLCAVEVKSFMSAAVNSEVCMRRTNFINNLGGSKYCDPLEGRNVYATLYPRNSPENLEANAARSVNANEKFIIVSCRLDTTSMFDGLGLGAMDSLMSLATLTHVAHMLRLLLPAQSTLPDPKRNVLFVAFNGESYDYIGSQRFVYDIEHLAFPTRSTLSTPISFENIEFMLDIGTLDDIENIKLHTLTATPLAQQLLQKLNRYAKSPRYGFNVNIESNVGYQIPPTSAQSFLRRETKFPALILNAVPGNKYYHSIYDDLDNVAFIYGNTSEDYTILANINDKKYFDADSLQMKVRNVSSIVAMMLYETLTGKQYQGNEVVNPILADEFFYCYLQSSDCPLFKASSYPNSPAGLPLPPMRYISVLGGSQESSGWTYRLLGYLLSHPEPNVPKENCSQLPLFYFAGVNGTGECRHTTQNFTSALSPAFLIEDYDWRSGEYSTWTESTWSQFSARIFLRPSNVHEITTLSIGIVVFIISFCLIYIISSRWEVLFEDVPASNAALPPPTAC
ncbi:nicastrin isoform X1 [Drosophila novamexicana]|uniref:nicastrin isoform X1 n=1 Tax=Drosophila novamexicana TaxID=47314 RepID=UPI0011E5990F|nr:nicastrin isoform X1 [Drosophila novamexicana]